MSSTQIFGLDLVGVFRMKWAVAIFSSRETLETLSSSVAAALKGTGATETFIDIMVNGNPKLAHSIGHYVETLPALPGAHAIVRAWCISLADAGHAWNQYVHSVWPGSDIAYFLTGYTKVMPDALTLISEGLCGTPAAWAAAGVPTVGRSSRTTRESMLRAGGLHGGFYAVRGTTLTKMRAIDFRLPLGIYRADAVIGAAIYFGLDPARNRWDLERILVEPRATWTFRALRWWHPDDIRIQLRRLMRQAQGALENQAIRTRFAIERRSAEGLPRTSAELVLSWAKANPTMARRVLLRHPLSFFALRRLRRLRDFSRALAPPKLISMTSIEG